MASAGDDLIFEASNSGQLGIGGCLAVVMYGMFSIIPLGLVAFTIHELPEAPWLLALYVASLFPLAVLFVVKRLMARHRLRILRNGTVEVALPFKSIRLDPADLSAIRTATILAGTPGTAPMRVPYVYFLAADGETKAMVPGSAFRREQWQGFFAALASVRSDVVVD